MAHECSLASTEQAASLHIDEGNVGEGLRKVSHKMTASRIELLGKEANIVTPRISFSNNFSPSLLRPTPVRFCTIQKEQVTKVDSRSAQSAEISGR